jgi:hypothetical protein
MRERERQRQRERERERERERDLYGQLRTAQDHQTGDAINIRRRESKSQIPIWQNLKKKNYLR